MNAKHIMQFYKDKLTIILTLKGREEFTFRYLRYLDNIKFPFHVLIADGGKPNPSFEAVMRKKENFPNVSYDYIRFPEDKTIMDFYNKVLRVLETIRTPYVMFNDNDDFPLPAGINQCIQFLEQNNDYVSAGGKVGGITLVDEFGNKNTPYGKVYNWHEYYSSAYSDAESCEQEFALERIESQVLSRGSCFFYNIYRIEPVMKACNALLECDIACLTFWDYIMIQMPMLHGKTKLFSKFYTYIRQRGSSEGAKTVKNFWYLLYLYRWMDDFDLYIEAMASAIFLIVGGKIDDIRTRLREMHATSMKSIGFDGIFWKRRVKAIIGKCWCYFKDESKYIPRFLKRRYLCRRLGRTASLGKQELFTTFKQIERLVRCNNEL